MKSGINFLAVVTLLLLFFGSPLISLVVIFRHRKRPFSSRKRVVLAVSGSVLLAWLTLVATHVVQVGPWRSGILCHGFSPEGQEYFAVQTFKGFVEPYQVSFYIRDARGVWQWHALAHDDDAWRSTAVEFTISSVVVTRKGGFRREIPREGGGIKQHPDSKSSNHPANLTAAEVAALHEQRYHR